MILKFDKVTGESFAALIKYIHSKENKVIVPQQGEKMITRIKTVNPETDFADTLYGLTLEILESLPKFIKSSGQILVDPSYISTVYTILGKSYEGKKPSADLDKIESKLVDAILGLETTDVLRTNYGKVVDASTKMTRTVISICLDEIQLLQLDELPQDAIVVALKIAQNEVNELEKQKILQPE